MHSYHHFFLLIFYALQKGTVVSNCVCFIILMISMFLYIFLYHKILNLL